MKLENIPKAADVKKGISVIWETLQCPICLEILTSPVSTKCDHQFCKYCMMKLLDNSSQNRASCPVCKARVTKRSLQESPGFQKLVAGLQDMIHAYEHDTGTNYFTGMMLTKPSAIVTEADIQKQNTTSENPLDLDNRKKTSIDDLSKSQSSTIKAQNGFARLMGLEDSSPLTTENEGLDSGLGGPPPVLERKEAITTDILELITAEEQAAVGNAQPTHKTRALIKTSDLPPLILEEETAEEDKWEAEEGHDEDEQPARKLSRRKRKKDSDPDKILKQRQKKSVEKVREWLMNVPNEEDIEVDKSDREVQDLDDSDSFSTASTIDLNQQHYDSFVNEKDGKSKALEDQVFGAVYKREKKRNEKFAPPPDILSHLSSKEETKPLEDEEKNKSDAEIEPEPINLADDGSECFEEADHMDTDVHNKSHNDRQSPQELSNEKNGHHEYKERDAPPVRKLRRNSRKKMRNALEQVDSDLQDQAKTEPENSEQKTTNKRKAKQTRSAKVKSGRVAKPLDLVEVPNGEAPPVVEPISKLGSDHVQVHIENYPSSEDQDVAVVKSNRRSKRLQSFVEEIRVTKTKPRQLKVTKSHNKVTSEEVALDKKNASPKCAKTNGCICDDDLGGIEKMGSCEAPNILKPTQPLQEVPNVDIPSEGGHCEPFVSDSPKSPGGVEEINTVLESDIQTDPNNVNVESMGSMDREELEDDSEIDTEQLLRSFKATKRKSFHLEAPNVKRSRSLVERAAQKYEDMEVLEKEKTAIQDTFQNNSNSLFSDVIPPSSSQALSKVQYQEEFDAPDKPNSNCGLKSSTSGTLSPNKVTTFVTPSPRLSVIPHVVNSGLRFTAAHLSDNIESKKHSANEPSKCSHISESQCSKAEENSLSLLDPITNKNQSPENLSEHLINAESSLTPDDLLTHPPALRDEAANSHSSNSAQSSVKSHPKRRKSRRLESSPEPESSGSNEELPSLAQILKRDPSSGQDKSEQEKVDSGEVTQHLTADGVAQSIRSPQCNSPDYVNSSQASVDLFGTPEESGDVVPVNNANASMELSQFSSEVLVTQQKIEMQNELLRLEKLMALVSEVLHEKENGLGNEQKDTKQNCKSEGLQPHNEGTEQEPESNGLQSAERGARAGPSEAKATSKPNVAKHCPTTETGHKWLSASVSKTLATSSSAQTHKNRESPSEDKENNTPPNDQRKPKMVLASSGLRPNEQIMVKKFAKRIGSRVVSNVTPDVTHVVMHTDEQLVCERTLKYFLGIAGRKWVVSFQWISECFKQKKLVDESPLTTPASGTETQSAVGVNFGKVLFRNCLFEVKGDVVNGHNHQGPMRARTTDEDDLLMKGYKIYFQGPFTDMTTDEMGWMVELCGASVVKDPSVLDGKQKSHQLAIVQNGTDISVSKYNSLSRVATVVTRSWLLDSVSAYTIQNCKNYTI